MKADNHFSPPFLRNDGRLSKDDGYGDEGGAYATEENEVAINETYGEWMHWGTELLNRTVYNSGYVCKVVGVVKELPDR